MSEPLDDRYANYRELAKLSERTATVEADMRQIMPALARIETMVAASRQPPPPQETAAALALHNVADAMRKNNNSGSSPPWLIAFAVIGALAIGLLAAKFVGLG